MTAQNHPAPIKIRLDASSFEEACRQLEGRPAWVAVAEPLVLRAAGGRVWVVDRLVVGPMSLLKHQPASGARVTLRWSRLPSAVGPVRMSDNGRATELDELEIVLGPRNWQRMTWWSGLTSATTPPVRIGLRPAAGAEACSDGAFRRTRFQLGQSWLVWRGLCIGVVGCGRLGSAMIEVLLASGIRDLVIVDDDRIEPGNLDGGASFAISDIGRHKVQVVAEQVGRLRPDARVTAVAEVLESPAAVEALMRADVLVAAADLPLPRLHLARLAGAIRVPLLDVGSGTEGFEGTGGADLRLILPGDCLLAMGGVAGQEGDPNQLAEADSMPGNAGTPINAAAAGVALQWLMALAAGDLTQSRWARLEIDRTGNCQMISRLGEEQHRPCPLCSTTPSIKPEGAQVSQEVAFT